MILTVSIVRLKILLLAPLSIFLYFLLIFGSLVWSICLVLRPLDRLANVYNIYISNNQVLGVGGLNTEAQCLWCLWVTLTDLLVLFA